MVTGIDGHLEAAGVELSDNNTLPKNKRTQAEVRKVINAMRSCEGAFNAALHAADEKCREAQSKVIELQGKNQRLLVELQKYRLKTELEKTESLTTTDRQRLLESAS